MAYLLIPTIAITVSSQADYQKFKNVDNLTSCAFYVYYKYKI